MNSRLQYPVIVADPPWQYRDQSLHRGGALRHYDTLPLADIKTFPVPAANDSWLFLWATNPLLSEALEVMEAWDFKYLSNLVWIKPRYGMGHTVRSAHEILLIGKRGKPIWNFHGQPSWLMAPVQDHSHKPEEIYDIIQRCVDGPYLELFARRQRHGWDGLGNQLDAFKSLEPEIKK